ncbi:MAG: PEP/pyruvate-binding domain-containing protein [Deltaproteobacteria bacterium]|nr:PEP/pyruvate-binding domain-containing protein [Deltaproteobacteria bacterium]
MGFLDFFRRQKLPRTAPGLREIFHGFQELLAANNEALALMGDLEEKLAGRHAVDLKSLRAAVAALDVQIRNLVASLLKMSGGRWPELHEVRGRIQEALSERLAAHPPLPAGPPLVRLEEATPDNLASLGGKAANLARLIMDLKLPVPPGVVATFSAYRLFVEQKISRNGKSGTLQEAVQARLAKLDYGNPREVEAAADDLQALMLAQPVPEELARALLAEARRLASEPGRSLVVRSSGALEDTAATFAGLYASFLGVPAEEVPARWREVAASQFSARALSYYHDQGIAPQDSAMSVLIQPLIPAQAAGVMFTTDPESCLPDRLIINAVWGLAPDLVGGKVSPDAYLVGKRQGEVLEARRGWKSYRLVPREGLLVEEPLDPDMAEAPVLSRDDCRKLSGLAQILEDYFGYPQDVEWLKDEQGNLVIVQSRPLRLTEVRARLCRALAGVETDAEVLLREGLPASMGVAAGPVHFLKGDQDLAEIPAGAVLVAPRTKPILAPVVPRLAALVTDVGSPTGHLALIAREYGIPALVDTFNATALLPEGETVTVDAFNVRVYRGRVEELLRFQPSRQPQLERSPLYEKLQSVADLIVPLTLVDPRHPSFRPENCRTYHDIAYFAHEKGIQVMFGLMDQVSLGKVPALRLLKLKTPLPLNLHLVDLGGGLASHKSPVPPEDILSIPMRALWQGISHPGISWAGPVPVNMGGFLHVLGQAAIRPPENFWDKTYAIVAANYVNYACRLGYHFQSVDCYCGPTQGENYLNFNFKGGAADELRRIRRAQLIAMVLERLGFEVERHLDVIRARFRKRPQPEMEERLDLLGRLMAYVRQMDMLMANEDLVHLLAERFLAGHYERPGEENGSLIKDEKA